MATLPSSGGIWTSFEANMTNYLSSYSASSHEGLATKLVDEYDLAVRQGKDMCYKNSVLGANKDALLSMTKLAFQVGYASPSYDIINKVGSIISLGVLAYWMGATLSMIPPPGAVSVISNTCIFPGAPIPIKLKNNESYDYMPKYVSKLFKLHLLTIAGVTLALVPAGSALIPVPFPWIGYL